MKHSGLIRKVANRQMLQRIVIFGTTARSISIIWRLKINRRKQECKGATFGSVNKNAEGTQPSKPLGQRPGRRP